MFLKNQGNKTKKKSYKSIQKEESFTRLKKEIVVNVLYCYISYPRLCVGELKRNKISEKVTIQ